MNRKMDNRRVLITGSTSGIGLASAKAFLRRGCRVIIHGAVDSTAPELPELQHDRWRFITAELSDSKEIERLATEAVSSFGGLDTLVNNAAVMTRSNLESTGVEAFDRTIAINLQAPLLLIRACIPALLKGIGSTVVNIGSVNALCGEKNQLAYSVAKGGLMTLTRNLADAYAARGVRFNQINPGWTLTQNEIALQRAAGQPDDWHERLPKSAAPIGRIMTPEEVGNHVVFWGTEMSFPTTGAVYECEQYPTIGRNPNKQD